jgi:hypothetical protein
MELKQVRKLLERDEPELAGALRAQRKAFEPKRKLLDSAIRAIREAQGIAVNFALAWRELPTRQDGPFPHSGGGSVRRSHRLLEAHI